MSVITAWSAVSGFGYGAAAFTEGLRAGRAVHRVPDFDIAERLGAKGTGSMDRSSALAVEAVGLLLESPLQATICCHHGAATNRCLRTDERTGVVLGTTSGSTHTQFEFTRESLIRRKPYLVNPAVMPYALMNSAAAQCAIRHGFTGPNTTIANGRLSMLAILRYATRLLGAGRASGLVCGAVEEYSDTRAAVERAAWGLARDYRFGEGAAVLYLEPDGPGPAEVLRVDTRLGGLAESLRDTLAGVDPGEIGTVVLASADPAERAAVDAVLARRPDVMLNPAELTGDTGAATGAFQLAALLAVARPGLAVVTGLDRDGTAGSALLRVTGSTAGHATAE
jgi:3-oxoacyl-[acyl-carrier-protein] synthase II